MARIERACTALEATLLPESRPDSIVPGWLTGLEPARTWATAKRSAFELQPHRNDRIVELPRGFEPPHVSIQTRYPAFRRRQHVHVFSCQRTGAAGRSRTVFLLNTNQVFSLSNFSRNLARASGLEPEPSCLRGRRSAARCSTRTMWRIRPDSNRRRLGRQPSALPLGHGSVHSFLPV